MDGKRGSKTSNTSTSKGTRRVGASGETGSPHRKRRKERRWLPDDEHTNVPSRADLSMSAETCSRATTEATQEHQGPVSSAQSGHGDVLPSSILLCSSDENPTCEGWGKEQLLPWTRP
jgi:hypothetical protein